MADQNINTDNGGLAKPVDKRVGILWYGTPDQEDLDAVTATSDLSAKFTNAGAITTDGVTVASDAKDPETYKDFNGNTFDSADATATDKITLSVLEMLRPAAMKLVYADAAITANAGGDKIKKISGDANPSDKCFIIDYKIKGTRVREIYRHVTFAKRGDKKLVNDALISREVTYTVLTGKNGNAVEQLFDVA